MGVTFFVYVFVTLIVVWALDSVNINKIFKKNKIIQARIFYFLLAIALIQLITSFIMEVFSISKVL
jgi:uncharacterized integral membrane protein (TIGR02327 family)